MQRVRPQREAALREDTDTTRSAACDQHVRSPFHRCAAPTEAVNSIATLDMNWRRLRKQEQLCASCEGEAAGITAKRDHA